MDSEKLTKKYLWKYCFLSALVVHNFLGSNCTSALSVPENCDQHVKVLQLYGQYV